MGERGPTKKYSDEERIMQGNPGNRPVDEAFDVEPQDSFADTLTTIPPAPSFLVSESDASGLALQAWNSVMGLLVNGRLAREGDESVVARYCRYLADWVICTNDIDTRGITLVTARGEARNPSFMARSQLEKDISAIEKQLGLNPRSRIELQSRLMASLRDLPLAGQRTTNSQSGGPVGFLNDD